MPHSLRLPICFALLFLFLVPVAMPLAPVFAVASLSCGIWAAVAYAGWKKDQQYSLDALRELHFTGGPPPPEEDEATLDELSDIVCPRCGEVYDRRVLICPRCKC